MTDQKLQELNKLIKEEIMILESAAKSSSVRRQIEPKERQLKQDLKPVFLIRGIGANGQFTANWTFLRNYIVILIKDVLEDYNNKYKDSKTFEEEKDVILQYFVSFEKPPFTLQRIAELLLAPEKYYKSTKKLLYAFQKLVNVGEPENR